MSVLNLSMLNNFYLLNLTFQNFRKYLIFYSEYRTLIVKHFGSWMRPHILWGLIWIQTKLQRTYEYLSTPPLATTSILPFNINLKYIKIYYLCHFQTHMTWSHAQSIILQISWSGMFGAARCSSRIR